MEFLNKYLGAFKMKNMNHLIAELNVYTILQLIPNL